MKVVILKYNAGNTASVSHALERLGIQPVLSDEPTEILSADKLIFPGVGHASAAMQSLKEKRLDELIPKLKQPVLGICLGMQLMCSHSEEGNVSGMGIFSAPVLKMTSDRLKVPHMGWNTLDLVSGGYDYGLKRNSYMYFVHSYYVPLCADTNLSASYHEKFSAGLRKDNFYAVQFHPEKSAADGAALLNNFLKL